MKNYSEFYTQLIRFLDEKSFPLHLEIDTSVNCIVAKSELKGIFYEMTIANGFPEVAVILNCDTVKNSYYYDNLVVQKRDIEQECGCELIWNRKVHEKPYSKISAKELQFNVNDHKQWSEIIEFKAQAIEKIYNTIEVRLQILNEKQLMETKEKQQTGAIPIRRIVIENFLGFKKIELPTTAGINLVIGENDTGKTGLMKLLYAVSKSWEVFSRKEYYDKTPFKEVVGEKIFNTFQPREHRRIGDLVTKKQKEPMLFNATYLKGEDTYQRIEFQFPNSTYRTINDCPEQVPPVGIHFNCIFIPAKEVLTAFNTIKYVRERLFLPGFDDTYLDLIKALEVPVSLHNKTISLDPVLNQFNDLFDGNIQSVTGEEPFIYSKNNEKYAISVTSEGIKKIGILSTLIRNRQLREGTILFMDEPDANLHPKATRLLVDMLVKIAKSGVQIFMASHSLWVINQLTMHAKSNSISIYCHSLFRNNSDYIQSEFSDLKDGLPSNPITKELKQLLKDMKNNDIKL